MKLLPLGESDAAVCIDGVCAVPDLNAHAGADAGAAAAADAPEAAD